MLAHTEYDHLVNSVKQTWAKNLPENYKLILNYGNGNKSVTYQIEDRVYSPFREEWSNIIKKTFDIFEYVKDWEFDYILRCCCGTYINIQELTKIIENLPSSNCYWGLPLQYQNDEYGIVEYATGSCYVISKDIIPVILNNKNSCKTIIDDMETGRILKSNNIDLIKTNTRMVTILENQCVYQVEGYNVEKTCDLQNVDVNGEYQFHFQNHVDLMQLIQNKVENL